MSNTDTREVMGLDEWRGAIRRGDLCETTARIDVTGHGGLHIRRRHEPVWARVAVMVGASLIFVSLVGLGAIGGYLWLSSSGI